MAKSTRIGLVFAFLFLLVGGFFYLGQTPSKTPDELIAQTLDDAATAAKRGDVGGVMDTISDDFRAGEWNKGRLRLILSRSLSAGRGTDYDVHVNAPIIRSSPRGDANERLVITRFAAFAPNGGEDYYKSNDAVELILRKETRRRMFVFREPYWRVVGIVNLAALPGSSGDDLGI